MAEAPPKAQVPRPAATLILLRPAASSTAAGPEVLMLKRTQNAAFLGGAYVFPGGSLDPLDADPRMLARVRGLTDERASRRLGIAGGALPYFVAAVRECFEEAGVALLHDSSGKLISRNHAEDLQAHRKSSFLEMLESENLFIPGDALAYYGHWITAPGRARRFDTRFFVAQAPEGQEGSHDANETVHHMWVSPREALARGERGEIELVFATQTSLRDLGRFDAPRAAFEYAAALLVIDTNRACRAIGRDGERIFRRADPPYFEIHWTDPEETGTTGYEIVPGIPKRLDRLVTRLTAPNPGAMTGPGTNTYLVGERDLAVIDPGPDIPSHIEKIVEAGQGRIRWIICTHTHFDHSPAAAPLKAATGAQVFGRPAPEGQDQTFKPDVIVEHGQRIQLGEMSDGVTLRAIRTPGHASNHVCYYIEQTKMLFTGDHVMQGSTVVINPPDGDMRAYLASLEALLAEDIAIIAPAHGYLIGEPHREVRRLVAHRLARESKVRTALADIGPAPLEALVPVVYDDVPERMHRWAVRSLTAHLEKLVAEGAVRASGGRFALVQSSSQGRSG
jgi:glyoxylase-like metal-dependent hydrolase (beta-lactamase superfamily II)/8-oxo-dGTP pyrophosphatase MutT (NUDIX family)